MKDIKVIYVAGPYTADTKEQKQLNLDKSEELAKSLTLFGYSCIIPHKLTAFWDYDENFIDWKESDWLNRCCFPILKKCDALILTEGWQKSSGCLKEIDFCTNNNIPIYKSIKQLLKHINKEAY